MNELSYYAPDYYAARQQFRQLAEARGAELHALPVVAAEGLYTDVALWRGPSDTLALHTSGVHGVEGFPGSAVQCAFLASGGAAQRGDHSLVLVHAVNPYGMQHLRRGNADNVDLNRNFLEQFATRPSNPIYGRISSVLNPQQRPSLQRSIGPALRLLTRYRFATLMQAVAQGQYDYPQGLFFGGTALSTEAERLLAFFRQHLMDYQRVVGLDFHTGLGKYARPSFYLDTEADEAAYQRTEALLDHPIVWLRSGKTQSYSIQGGFIAWLRQLYATSDFMMVTQEIGTVGPLRIVRALREENFYFHHAPDQRADAAQRLKAAFCPDDAAWQRAAVRAGVQALERLLALPP